MSDDPDDEVLRQAAARGLGLSTSFVLSRQEPIRLVVHNEDGTWDFFCNTTDDGRFIQTVHVAEMFELFAADLQELRDLPRGWLAERQERGDAWMFEEHVGQSE